MSMAHNNIARKAYSAEQLLALRHSASDETAIQIEAKAQDGAIKGMLVSVQPPSSDSWLCCCSSSSPITPFRLIIINNIRFPPLSMHSSIKPTVYIHYHAFFPHATKDKLIIQSFFFSSRAICKPFGGRYTITCSTEPLFISRLANRRSRRPCCPQRTLLCCALIAFSRHI
jgi:hypothetical protein